MNAVLVSTVQQDESVIHIHVSPLLGFPSFLIMRLCLTPTEPLTGLGLGTVG